MDRRHLLRLVALAFVLVLAGCQAAGSVSVDAVNDTELADGTSRSVSTEQRLDVGGDRRPWRIAKRAIEDGSYYAESTDDSGFEALVDTITRHEEVTRRDGHGTWLVRYEGELFLVELEFASFLDS